jgi:hypothetical protein
MANDKNRSRPSNQRDRHRPRPQPQGGVAHAQRRGRGQNDQGNAKRNYERYMELARAAVSAGDPIEGENLYQHAEHYFRAMKEHERGRDDQGDQP